jgi:hypothetical protein
LAALHDELSEAEGHIERLQEEAEALQVVPSQPLPLPLPLPLSVCWSDLPRRANPDPEGPILT